MLIADTTMCTNCEKEINWYYQIPQMVTSRILDVDRIPKDKAKVFRCIYNKDDSYYMTYCCPKCGNNNTFNYESKRNGCLCMDCISSILSVIVVKPWLTNKVKK